MAVTATFGVLTTIAAFTPMLFVGGIAGSFLEAVAAVVILCLIFSLVESKLILPAHLAHSRITPVNEAEIFSPYRDVSPLRRVAKFFQRLQRRTQHGLQWIISHIYSPLLDRALSARWISLSVFAGMLLLTIGLVRGGFVSFVIFPKIPGEYVQMSLTMQNGTPTTERNDVLLYLERALYEVRDDYLRETPDGTDPLKHVATFTEGPTSGQIIVEMPMAETQTITGDQLSALWRERAGDIPGVRELRFSDGNNLGGEAPLSFALSGNNFEALEAAATELADRLRNYNGVFDVQNSASPGGDEISLRIKPAAEALGITLNALGTQVRQAFFGEEVQRIQRGSDELRVMLRYPLDERRSVANLENMLVTTPDGDRVPFADVADVSFGAAYSQISRRNGKRTITVSADLDTAIAEPRSVVQDISNSYIPGLLAKYSGVSYALEGASLEEQEFLNRFALAALAALCLIYALIAIPLISYWQPFIIMSVIPFGFIGAVVGHLVLGAPISMFSLFGLIALAGVVVNDSLIMIDFVNKARAAGVPVKQAIVQSGKARFRAIILTSLTTAIGLMPIMMEQSSQAQFVIPMAISLSFGILFATVITLILVPVLYMMQLNFLANMRRSYDWLRGASPRYADADSPLPRVKDSHTG